MVAARTSEGRGWASAQISGALNHGGLVRRVGLPLCMTCLPARLPPGTGQLLECVPGPSTGRPGSA